MNEESVNIEKVNIEKVKMVNLDTDIIRFGLLITVKYNIGSCKDNLRFSHIKPLKQYFQEYVGQTIESLSGLKILPYLMNFNLLDIVSDIVNFGQYTYRGKTFYVKKMVENQDYVYCKGVKYSVTSNL